MSTHKKKQAIVDTGFVVALWHNKDDHHQVAEDWAQNRSIEYELVTTDFVIQEVFRLLTKRINKSAALEFLEILSEDWIKVMSLPLDWAKKAIVLLKRFNDKEKLDLTDVSLVILASCLGHGNILTVDIKDFTYLRWGENQLFENLLYPHTPGTLGRKT